MGAGVVAAGVGGAGEDARESAEGVEAEPVGGVADVLVGFAGVGEKGNEGIHASGGVDLGGFGLVADVGGHGLVEGVEELVVGGVGEDFVEEEGALGGVHGVLLGIKSIDGDDVDMWTCGHAGWHVDVKIPFIQDHRYTTSTGTYPAYIYKDKCYKSVTRV